MKTTSFILLASAASAALALAADNDPAARQYQIYPKNLARQHMGSNLFIFNPANQTYVPTEAAAAWLDDDVATGWPALAGKQHYLLAFAAPELVSNLSVSGRPAEGSISIYAGDEPTAPGNGGWTPLAQNVAFNSINEKKLEKPFTRFAKYLLIETDLANPGPLYSLNVYGEQPATLYTLRPREQSIDARAIFGQFNNQTTFNANGLYTQSTVTSAKSAESPTGWQKAIDDNPASGLALSESTTDASAVIRYGQPQNLSRVSVLTDGTSRGKIEFFAINDANGETLGDSLDGRTPTVSMVLDGSTKQSSIDFPSVGAMRLALRWSPVVAGETLNLREVNSFGSDSLNDYEVALRSSAVTAYDTGGSDYVADGKDMKDPKDSKNPAEVAAGPGGSPYFPGALGFPPNINGRRIPKSNK